MRKPGRWILLVLVLAVGTWVVMRRGSGGGYRDVDAVRVARVVPDTVRIRVEVLNATNTRGLARRATAVIRDAGFDVVSAGNWTEPLDSSLVLVRSGRMDWGALAAKALGGARVEARPDSSRYLDLTIIVGSRWRAPPEPFDP
jgi:hypothetical protein